MQTTYLLTSPAMPDLVIVAGPNGTGKTTFTKQFVRVDDWVDVEFVNADEIASLLPKDMLQGQKDIRAARAMITRINELVEQGKDFILETTLASLRYAQAIPRWRVSGYHVTLIYLQMPDAQSCVQRVAKRKAVGGHTIPEATIIQRFGRSQEYLESHYKPIVDVWHLYDSLEGDFQQVASGGLE